MITVQEALSLVTLSREEERQLARLEAIIDATIHEKFDGGPVSVQFDETVPVKLLHALRRKFSTPGDGGSWQTLDYGEGLLFSPLIVAPSTKPLREQAPFVHITPPSSEAAPGKRLLIRFPTRSRPVQALTVLQAYRDMAGIPVTIEVIIDEDDTSMLVADVLQRLNALGCVITVGAHKSKVEACNGGRVSDWDVMMLASDDMMPVVDQYAKIVLEEMERNFPYLDGAIYFDDGYQGANLCTLPTFGRRLYGQFGHVYNPAYRSLFCDTEQTQVLLSTGRLAYVDKKIIEHRHHVWGRAKKDALYAKNDALWDRDEAVFKERQKRNFDLPAPGLSICICTLPARRVQLDRLLDHLWAQILTKCPRGVEVVVDSREGITIGQKRQALLERARGAFVAFIDDDDLVAFNYIERVVSALQTSPNIDCVALNGIITTDGERPERFEHSLKYTEWGKTDGIHRRSPNHLNPIRRELALKASFPSVNHAEDFEYSKRLLPLLKNEVSTGIQPLYYYFYRTKK